MRRATLSVDLCRLAANYRTLTALIKKKNPSNRGVIAVLKADAYGHGAEAAARVLLAAGCRRFAVATLEEALCLSPIVGGRRILVLGYVPPTEARLAAACGFSLSVYSFLYAKELEKELRGEKLRIHIKLNSGMNRTGFSLAPGEMATSLSELAALFKSRSLHPAAYYSHLASADTADALYTLQKRRFSAALARLSAAGLSLPAHLGASAEALRCGGAPYPYCRLGLSLFGYVPMGEAPAGLTPIAALTAPLIQRYTVGAGERVGYNGRFAARESTTLGILPLGYADGLPRNASGAHFYYKDRPLPIIGRISMDSAAVLLPKSPEPRFLSPLRLFGEDSLELMRLCRHIDTIPYELLARLGSRIDRKYTDGNSTEWPADLA